MHFDDILRQTAPYVKFCVGVESSCIRFCLWCLCHRDVRHMPEHPDFSNFRTTQDALAGVKDLGYKDKPLFGFIKWENIILDELHSMLRVTDKLLELLIEELQQIGTLLVVSLSCADADFPGTHELLPAAFSSIGVLFNFYVSKDGILSWTSLSGVSKKKMLEKLPVASFFPEDPSRGARVQAVWKGFLELYGIYSNIEYCYQNKTYSPSEFAEKAKAWIQELTAPSSGDPDMDSYQRGMYSDSAVTPYMHAVVQHIPQMMTRLLGFGFTLQLFSCHSLEKKNHSQTCDVFRCSLKGGCHSTEYVALLERELVLFLRYHNCEDEKC